MCGRRPRYEIITSDDPEKALELLANTSDVAVIISDMKMPQLNGAEFLGKAKLITPNARRIILSAYADSASLMNSVNLGEIHQYLLKPWEKVEIISILDLQIHNYTVSVLTERHKQELELVNKNLWEMTEKAGNAEQIKLELKANVTIQNELKIKNEQLLQLNFTKNKFFSIISHDLKSPVASWIGLLGSLKDGYDSFSEEEIKGNLELIHDSSQVIYNLLEALLEWAQTQTGKIANDPKDLDLRVLIDRNIELLENAAKRKSIKIVFDNSQKCNIWADENMIMTVIRNLINNAIKFSYPDGKIEIAVKELEHNFRLTIKDYGIGIAYENITNIFRIDSRFRQPGTQKEMGTGLGLVICKEFIDSNKGQIGVLSEIEKGSTFYIILPKTKLE